MKKLICILFFVTCSLSLVTPIHAQSCDSSCGSPDECRDKIGKCQEAWSQMEKAKKPHADALKKMEADIIAFQSRITGIEKELLKKAAAIAEGEKELGDVLLLAGVRIRQFYIRSSTSVPMLTLFSSSNVGSALRSYAYQQAVTSEDKKVITQTAMLVKDLEDRKKKLEKEDATLSVLKSDLDVRAVSVRKLVGEATAYQTKLTNLIASLTAQQQSFLAQKLAGLGIPLYAMSGGGCSSDLTNGKDPGFSGGFGFFTFGVPNRVGLNQYGAYGRANAGQNYETILRAYYAFDSISDVDSNTTIKVNDSNSVNNGNIIWTGNLKDYIKRIYEVPADWPTESLKAQVIAIRSYVLATTDNGNMSICANQYCQVFKKEEKGGAWNQAVEDTGGKVMMQGGKPIKAFFSSTHGGYAFNTGDLTGWSQTSYTKRMVDTTSGSVSNFSDLKNTAYDKDSPWFYCDWGGRSEHSGTAWLHPEEVADIVNVYLLAQQDSASQKHLTQPDKPNPDGVDTWNAETVRSKLGGDAYTAIDSVSVSADFSTGRTTQVTLSGNGKSTSINGNDFKTYFNLRAPVNIQIVGPLFNVERK